MPNLEVMPHFPEIRGGLQRNKVNLNFALALAYISPNPVATRCLKTITIHIWVGIDSYGGFTLYTGRD